LLEDEWYRRDLIACAAVRILALKEVGLDLYKKFGPEIIDSRLGDPYRIFVKGEPHKQAKAKAKRWRLIWASSIVSQMVERFLYYGVTKDEIERWHYIPSKPGMGSSDEDQARIVEQLSELMNPPLDDLMSRLLAFSDVNGWDLSVKRWTEICAEFSYYLQLVAAGYEADCDYFRICMANNIVNTRPVALLSDGSLLLLAINGLMLSGRFVTSWLNSRVRVFLVALRGENGFAMGDDCVEGSLSTYDVASYYACLGYPGEASTLTSVEGVEFCSLYFTKKDGVWNGLPQNWARTLFRLLAKTRLPPEEVEQFLFEVRHVRLSQSQVAQVRALGAHE
jgi:uncharacterized protein YjhX (UPF0386 family)